MHKFCSANNSKTASQTVCNVDLLSTASLPPTAWKSS